MSEYGVDYFLGRLGRAKPYAANRRAFERYMKHIASLTSLQGKRLLDLACATGGFTHWSRDHGACTIGVDISHYALQQAIKVSDSSFAQASVAALPFEDRSMDITVAFDIIEHLLDPCPMLREVYRVLKPSGWLFLSTPNARSFKRPLLGRNWNSDETHVRFYQASEIQAVAQQFGFNIARTVCFTESRFAMLEAAFEPLNSLYRGDYLFIAVRKRNISQ